ncbi:MAG: hypothetical protein ACRDXX_15580 [Stackebrandtia sp.]
MKIALLDERARSTMAPALEVREDVAVSDLRGAEAAVACDENDAAVDDVIAAGIPLLVGVDALCAHLDRLSAATNWQPLLPLVAAPDVIAARKAVAEGRVGAITDVTITVYYGCPARRSWRDDEARPATEFESAVWAADLAAEITRLKISRIDWLRRSSDETGPSVAAYRLGGSIMAVVHHRQHAAGPGPAYTAAVHGSAGQLLLRQPFAPGGLAHWRSSTREFIVPALPKHNPVSTPGGWEVHTLLDSLSAVTTRPDAGARRRGRVLHVIRHLEKIYSEGA